MAATSSSPRHIEPTAHEAAEVVVERLSLFGKLRRAAPTFVVVAAIIGLAVWGQSTEGTMPKFSALFGRAPQEVSDWCDEHNVPESVCVECNPKLMPVATDYGWCSAHGVMQCPLEHPDIAQLKSQPTITPAMLARADRAISLRPRAENNSRCNLHLKRIQFASLEAVEKVGVDIAIGLERPIVESIVANGEIGFDETRRAHYSSRLPGTIWRVEKQLGDRVAKGDVLAFVDAADVGRLKSEFLQAFTQVRLKQDNLERMRPLAGSVVPAREFVEAQADADSAYIQLHRAQQALVNLGLPVDAHELGALSADQLARQIQLLGLPADLANGPNADATTSNLLPVRSSLDGVVVERRAVEGEVVDAKSQLFDVADTSRLWLTLNVRQEDAKYLALGQKTLFRTSDSRTEVDSTGTVSWISPTADDVTRMVKVRVDLANGDG